MKNTKTKVLLSSIATIAMSASLAVGGTFALFTSEDKVNIAVTSGTVDVTATIKSVSLYSMDEARGENVMTFENGGTASLDAVNSNLTLTNVTPGDKAVVAIDFENNSNVAIQYRMGASIVGDLAQFLTVSKVENSQETELAMRYTAWSPLAANAQPADMTIAIELPEEIGNDAQIVNQTATTIAIAIEAVQGNADTTPTASTATELADALTAGGLVRLNSDITITDNKPIAIPEGVVATIDLNGKTLTATHHKNDGAALKNSGTLTITGGVISSTGENGGSAIQNSGTLTVNNATLNGAPNANGSWPSYTVNNTGVMTMNGVKITSNHGSVASYGDGAVLTMNNCEIDMAGIPGFTSHGVYTYSNGKVIINGGTYANHATDQNASGASVINGAVEINGGEFKGRLENYYGTPVIKGGTFTVNPSRFVAAGYVATENNGVWTVTAE